MCYGFKIVTELLTIEQVNKYGTSYKVINLRRDMPTTAEGTYLFLSEILTENQAKVLVEHYPNIIQKVKNNDLADIDLSKLKGIGDKTFEKIKDNCLHELGHQFDYYYSSTKLDENLIDITNKFINHNEIAEGGRNDRSLSILRKSNKKRI